MKIFLKLYWVEGKFLSKLYIIIMRIMLYINIIGLILYPIGLFFTKCNDCYMKMCVKLKIKKTK